MARVGAHASLPRQLRSRRPDMCANCTLLIKEPCFLISMELKSVDVVSELERKNAASANRRKNQPRFRREVLGEEPRCIIVPDGDTCRFFARIAVCCEAQRGTVPLCWRKNLSNCMGGSRLGDVVSTQNGLGHASEKAAGL